MEKKPIGQIVGTEQSPNTAYDFRFWAYESANLGIGSIVRSDAGGCTVFGTVIAAYAYNDVPNALVDYLGREGSAEGSPPTVRPEIRLFHAGVIRREPEEPLSAVGIGPVFACDPVEVTRALRMDSFEKPIPAGAHGFGDKLCAIQLDADFLLGPEAGHLNITGTSGLAAKTSYLVFLLQSIFQSYPRRGEQGAAAVMFNVKGGDLLFLDQPPSREPDESQMRLWDACGLKPRQFDSVRYYAPYFDEGQGDINTLRNHEDLTKENPVQGFSLGVKDMLRHSEVWLASDDLDVKAESFLMFLEQDVVEKGMFTDEENGVKMEVATLSDLVSAVKKMAELASPGPGGQDGPGYRHHHLQTIRKVLNRLNGVALRFTGLVTKGGEARPPLPDRFEDRSLHVIDVSKLSSDGQELVFHSVISTLRERMEARNWGVDRLIVVVDELNKYAPSSGGSGHIGSALRDIAARGRYMGLVLFSAQQFRSRVDPQVVANMGSAAYGHIQMEELTNPIYTVYSQAVREKLAHASQGEMMIRHPHFSQPVFVKFPIPYVLNSTEALDKFRPSLPKGLKERLEADAIMASNGTPPAQKIMELVEQISKDTEALRKAHQQLHAEARGGSVDVEGLLKRFVREKPQVIRAQPRMSDEDDPFKS